ncbi:MAG TPA: TIR-like protein FxsC [Streptosporangiaceae bacterium]|nr:TIR-like protein FxsC [Streptosporangiaceae bacterium]
MGAKGGVAERAAYYRPYFYLSYARPATAAENPDAAPDPLVSRFFDDLLIAVRRHAAASSGPIEGFFDQHLLPDSDWKESVNQALGTAQVFVPLYSVPYLVKSLPGREWECFRRRMVQAGMGNPLLRFVPVLWAPLPETQVPPGFAEALALGAGEPAYVENGLWALLKIPSYRHSYRSMVNKVAEKVVAIAEEAPIQPSEIQDIDAMTSAFTQPPLAVFAIETAVPTARDVATRDVPGGHVHNSADWRPFPQQDRPLTDYARDVAERLDFEARADEITTVSQPATRRPGIILIDPWFIADDTGRSALRSAVDRLPRWVLPLVILEHPDDSRTQDLARQVRDILGALPTAASRQGAQGVSSLDDFLAIVPRLVIEAERQYKQYRSGRYRTDPRSSEPVAVTRRPRLGHPAPPSGAASPHDRSAEPSDSLGDTPDD